MAIFVTLIYHAQYRESSWLELAGMHVFSGSFIRRVKPEIRIEVLKAEGLQHHKTRGYHVECTCGNETLKTKTLKQSKSDTAVNWDELLVL